MSVLKILLWLFIIVFFDNEKPLFEVLTPYIIATGSIVSSWLILWYNLKRDREKRIEDATNRDNERNDQKDEQALSILRNFFSLYLSVLEKVRKQIEINNEYVEVLKKFPLHENGRLKFEMNINLERFSEFNYERVRDAFHRIFTNYDYQEDFEKLFYAFDYIKGVLTELHRIDEVILSDIFQLKAEAVRNFEKFDQNLKLLHIEFREQNLAYYKVNQPFLLLTSLYNNFHAEWKDDKKSDLGFIKEKLINPISQVLATEVLFYPRSKKIIAKMNKYNVLLDKIYNENKHLWEQVEQYTESLHKHEEKSRSIIEELQKKIIKHNQ